jgi:hypothetical protein
MEHNNGLPHVPSFGAEINGHDMVVGSDIIRQGLKNATCVSYENSWKRSSVIERVRAKRQLTRNRVE